MKFRLIAHTFLQFLDKLAVKNGRPMKLQNGISDTARILTVQVYQCNVVEPSSALVSEGEFNKRVQADARVSNVLLPIREGLMVAHKH